MGEDAQGMHRPAGFLAVLAQDGAFESACRDPDRHAEGDLQLDVMLCALGGEPYASGCDLQGNVPGGAQGL